MSPVYQRNSFSYSK